MATGMELEALQPREGIARQRNRLQNDCDGRSNEVKDVYRDGKHDTPNKRRDNRDPIPETVHRCKRQAKQMLLQKSWSAASRLRGEGAILTSKSLRCRAVNHFPWSAICFAHAI